MSYLNEQPEVDIPCKTCDKFIDCTKKIEELKIEQYGENPDVDNDDEEFSFHSDLMIMLTRDCEILSKYFPFDVVSRDGLMQRPYEESMNIEDPPIPNEEEWDMRNLVLFWFFKPYNIITD